MAIPPSEPRAYSDLVAEIQRLQADRQTHVDALRAIDEVLSGIAQTLHATTQAAGDGVVRLEVDPAAIIARQRASLTARDGAAEETASTPTGGRRKYNKLPQTGEDFVLWFVKEHGAPTTLEINAAWRAQGRGGVANNVIGRLLKEHLLAREPLEDRRGSRYRLTNLSNESAA